MKTYTEPKMSIVICHPNDIVTLSVNEAGLGDSRSFEQVMDLK